MFEHRAIKNKNPGPGSYRAPSDFGHYDGNVYNKSGAIAYLNETKQSRAPSKTK